MVLQRRRRCSHQERDHRKERSCDSQPRSSVYRHPANTVAADEAAQIEQHRDDSDQGAYRVERAKPHQNGEHARSLHFRKDKIESNAKIGNQHRRGKLEDEAEETWRGRPSHPPRSASTPMLPGVPICCRGK